MRDLGVGRGARAGLLATLLWIAPPAFAAEPETQPAPDAPRVQVLAPRWSEPVAPPLLRVPGGRLYRAHARRPLSLGQNLGQHDGYRGYRPWRDRYRPGPHLSLAGPVVEGAAPFPDDSRLWIPLGPILDY